MTATTKPATLSKDTAASPEPGLGLSGGPASGPRAAERRRRHLPAAVRAAGAPLLAGALALTGLGVWTATGGAGTLARVHLTVTGAMIPSSGDADAAAAYLSIANTGAHDDELLSVTTGVAGQAMLAGSTEAPGTGAGTMTRLSGIAVPAHTTVALGPYGRDIMLMRPARLTVGQKVELTLHFRAVGAVKVQAMVVPLGTAPS